jgi:hypothetical protein
MHSYRTPKYSKDIECRLVSNAARILVEHVWRAGVNMNLNGYTKARQSHSKRDVLFEEQIQRP